jgi:hypothetical protein
MKIGDKVKKVKGYAFEGEIVSVFENSKGETRIVAEHEGSKTDKTGGMLHIFSESQLEVTEDETSDNWVVCLKSLFNEFDGSQIFTINRRYKAESRNIIFNDPGFTYLVKESWLTYFKAI